MFVHHLIDEKLSFNCEVGNKFTEVLKLLSFHLLYLEIICNGVSDLFQKCNTQHNLILVQCPVLEHIIFLNRKIV